VAQGTTAGRRNKEYRGGAAPACERCEVIQGRTRGAENERRGQGTHEMVGLVLSDGGRAKRPFTEESKRG
jgi:hypothetical protein